MISACGLTTLQTLKQFVSFAKKIGLKRMDALYKLFHENLLEPVRAANAMAFSKRKGKLLRLGSKQSSGGGG